MAKSKNIILFLIIFDEAFYEKPAYLKYWTYGVFHMLSEFDNSFYDATLAHFVLRLWVLRSIFYSEGTGFFGVQKSEGTRNNSG